MEHRLTITITEYGADVDAADRVLDAFNDQHPEVGVAVAQETGSGHLLITFSLDADDVNDAYERGRPVFVESMKATGLEPTQFVDLHVETVPDLEPAEAVPA
jgi:hypothetical protein